MSDLRMCTKCGTGKPPTEFAADRKSADGRLRRCKTCVNADRRDAWAKRKAEGRAVPDSLRAAQRRYRENNPGKCLASQRRSKYGISEDQYNALFATQGGRCAICQDSLDAPHVDHDHVTGAVRGLLCGHCNKAIGLLRDDPKAAARAAAYLMRSALEATC